MALIKLRGIDFDSQEQLKDVRTVLSPGERLFFVYDCAGAETGYVGLTDRRLIFQDKGFIPGIPMITSVPLTAIDSVTAQTSGRVWGASKLSVACAAWTYEFRFRSSEKAHDVCRSILKQMGKEREQVG